MTKWSFFDIPTKSREDTESPSKRFVYSRSIRMDREPKTVVTVFSNATKDDSFTPVHNQNCFFEDKTHDWQWKNGWFTYGSRVAGPEDEVTVGVVFDSDSPTKACRCCGYSVNGDSDICNSCRHEGDMESVLSIKQEGE